MSPRDTRLAPLSLRHALLLLVPLALLGTALLGLLAQSASAQHGTPVPGLSGPVSPDDNPTPQWTFVTPAAESEPGVPVYDEADAATRTVDVERSYTTECVYGSVPATAGEFAGASTCSVVFAPAVNTYDGAVTTDGTYVLSVRTVETTTTTTTTDDGVNPPVEGAAVTSTSYSAIESAAYVYDTTAPVVTVTAPGGAAYTGWQVSVTDASAVTLSCSLEDPDGSTVTLAGSTCNTGSVQPSLSTTGNYTLSVTATDAQGRSTGPESATFTYDGVAPVVTFVEPQPSGPASAQPTWSWTISESATTTCGLTKDGGAPTPVACSNGSYTGSLGSVGMYTLTVTATDPAGNASAPVTSEDYFFDDVAPSVALSPAGSTRGNADTVTWTVSVSDGMTATCTLGADAPVACVDGQEITATLTSDGSVTLTASVSDSAGNTSSTSSTYTRDTVVEFSLGTPTGPSSNPQPTWVFDADETVTFVSCVLTADGTVIAAGGTCGPTGYTPDPLTGPSGTRYVLQVTVDDGVNSTTFTSGEYVLDTSAPTVSATSPAVTGNDRRPVFSFASDSDATTVSCSLTSGAASAVGSCAYDPTTGQGSFMPTADLPTTSGTSWTFTVTVTDLAGNTSAPSAPVTYLLDTQADTVTAVAPAGPSSNTTPTFTFDYDTAAQSVSCVLTDGTLSVAGDCTFDNATTSGSFTPSSPLPTTSGTTWTFTVTVTDVAGNSASSVPVTYLLDTEADAPVAAGPSGPSNNTSPTFTFDYDTAAQSVSCSLTDGTTTITADCVFDNATTSGSFTPSSPLPNAAGTTWTFTVTVTDLAGNISAPSAPVTYLLDTQADTVTAVAPAGPSNNTTPTFTFDYDTAAQSVSCVLTDGTLSVAGDCTFDNATTSGSFTPSSPLPTTSGTTWTFTVTVTDLAGNSASSVPVTYLLDTEADTVTAVAPASPSNNTTPTFTFDYDTTASAVTCSLTDGTMTITADCVFDNATTSGSFTPSSPLPTTSGTTWTFTVSVTDLAGNSASSVPVTYLLDTQADAPVAAGPSGPSNNTSPTFTFEYDTTASAVTCSLTDGTTTITADCVFDNATTSGSFTPSSPLPNTASTTWTFTVTVTDLAGNISAPSAPVTYLLDTSAPTVSATSPAVTGNDRRPVFSFTSDSDATTVSCSLTSGAASAVGSCVFDPVTGQGSFTPTSDLPTTSGTPWTFTVTVTDLAGNSASSAPVTYLLDTDADAPVAAGPSGPSNNTSPTFTFEYDTTASAVTCSLTDGTTTITADCAFDNATTSGSFTPSSPLSATPGTTWTFTVTVTDLAGNSASSAPVTYLLDTEADTVTAVAPASPSNNTTPTFTFDYDTTASAVTCTLTDGTTTITADCVFDNATTSGSFTPSSPLPTTSGRTWTFTATVTDLAGNSASSVPVTYLLDTEAEAAKVSGPAAYDDDVRPVWTWTAEDGATVTCVLTGGDGNVRAVSCANGTSTPSADLPETSSTVWTLVVTVVDALGNTTVLTFDPYELDTIADATKVSGPAAYDDDVRPVWTWTAEDGATVTCVLTGGDGNVRAVSCANGTSTPTADLPETSSTVWTLVVTVVDALDNTTVLTFDPYELDTIADATKVSGPAAYDDDVRPVWTWTAEDGATVTCVLTDGDGNVRAVSCANGTSTPTADLPETSSTVWTLVVTVVDALDNTTVLTFDPYELDTIADYSAGTEPATPSNNRTPQWTWTAEPDATVTCVLTGPDGEVFNDDCTTPGSFTAPELDATTGADYVLTITIVDSLGNTTVIEYDPYHLDTVLELDVDGPTGPSPDRTPEWTFTSEPLVTLECTLVGPGGDPIAGGICDQNGYRAPPLTEDGDHVLTIRGVDAAGNDVTQTFTYDLDTLHFTIVGPTGPSPVRTPTWTFTDEPYVSAHCVLTGPDGEAFNGPCTTTSSFTADELPLTPGADYVLTVTVVDSIGNEGTLTAPAYRLDTQLPVATITVPTSPSRIVSVTWTVAVDEPLLSATCELRRDGDVVLSLDNCPGSTVVSLPGDGRYDLVVTLVDLAGNLSVTTSTVLVHDATVPTAPVVSPTTLTTNRTTATWTIAAEGGTSVTTCRVLREGVVFADWAPCGSTFSLPLGTDGSYVLEVVSTDPVGPGPTTRVTYLLDTVPPAAPQLTGSTGPAQGRTPTWTIATDTGTTVECRVVRGGVTVIDWAPCAGSVTADLTGQADGVYVVEARATDAAGNISPVGSSAGYVLDTTAPVAPVVTGPAGPSQQRAPSFTWTGEIGARAECLLSRDGVAVGGWTPCTPGYSPTLDRDGTWTLTVRLTDAAGNVSDAAASGGYVLDTTPPPAPIVTPPKTPGRDLAPSWGAVVETGATLECRLLGADSTPGAWAPCTLPHITSLEGRPDGTYVLEVRATDVAGNVSAVGTGTYVLDTVAPAAAVITSPTSPSRSRTPTFTFTVEPLATTRCRLTSGATVISDLAACSSPTSIDLTGLPDGTYTLSVRVADAAGNPGPAATATYVLDTTGPLAPVLTLSPASPSPARSVTWAFTYEPGSTLICRLTFPTGSVREISGCASPLTIDLTGLPDGTYTLTVRAVDAAGNVGAVLTAAHVIDSTALAPPQVTGPATPGSTRTPRWTISAGTTECRLTRGTTVLRDWVACAGGFTADLFGQPDGTYVLSVRSKDATGAVSAATTSRYVLDTTAPGAATVVPPPTPSTNRNPTWTIASSELGATAECRVLLFGSVLTDWAPCAVSVPGAPYSALDLTGRGDGTYTLVVRLKDAAGNLGPETSSPYVLDTAAPVGVGVTGPASPGNDTTPTWTFTTAGTAQLECRLTSLTGVVYDWETCAGSYTADLTDLPDGTYTLAVRAVSEAGTPGPETTSAYVLSTVAPDGPTALALSGTRPTSNDRSPTWTFTLPSGTTATCTVVSNGRTVFDGPCSSPFTLDLSSASDGSYTLSVRSIDKAGTRSEPVTSTYVLDTVPTSPPVFTLTPGATGSNLDPQWRFTVVYDATAECRLVHEGVATEWGTCTSPYTAVLTGRPDGRYTLEVRAVDKAGNSSAPRSSTYLLDRTAVAVATFTSTPETPSVERNATWTFSAPDGTTLECRLIAPDGTTAWGACAEGRYRLELRNRGDGDYVLEVRVVDVDGRVGSASRATYTLDTIAPEAPRFSDVPPAAGNVARPTWSWNATTDDRVECRLVRVGGGAVTDWAPCESPYEARLTAQGSYALELRVIDAAGNVSPTTSSPYRYDTTPPATPVFTARPPAGGADRTVAWTFAMPADVTGATCTVTRGGSRIAAGPCNGRYELNLAGQPDGTYTLTVRFTDAAGNVSRPASSDYALRTVGLGGPPRVDPPTAPTSPGTSTPPAPGPTGPGRGGTGAGPVTGPSSGGSTSRPNVPIVPTDDDVPRTADRPSTFTPRPSGEEEPAAAAPEPEPSETSRARNPLLADPLPIPNAPELLRDAVTSTITRPTLPLALLAIVILFLLAQNRIDRRDPKLASAPVEAEPELDFTTIIRRPGGAHS